MSYYNGHYLIGGCVLGFILALIPLFVYISTDSPTKISDECISHKQVIYCKADDFNE